MISTCRAAGALALAALFAATAPAATAQPFTKAQISQTLIKCQRLARRHGPWLTYVKFGHGELAYTVPAVNLGPSQAPDDLLIETIENGNTSHRLREKPIFTLVCLNGKVANDTNGAIHLYPDGPKELYINEVLGNSLKISRWYKDPLKSICVTSPNGEPQRKPCWPWIEEPSRPQGRLLSFPIPYEPGRTYDYMLHVSYLGEDIPVDPQIINH